MNKVEKKVKSTKRTPWSKNLQTNSFSNRTIFRFIYSVGSKWFPSMNQVFVPCNERIKKCVTNNFCHCFCSARFYFEKIVYSIDMLPFCRRPYSTEINHVPKSWMIQHDSWNAQKTYSLTKMVFHRYFSSSVSVWSTNQTKVGVPYSASVLFVASVFLYINKQ